MKHLWRALLVVLVLGAFMPGRSAAQGISTQTGGGQGAGLQLGQATKALPFRDGVGVIMLCERKEAASPIPTREQLVDNLTRTRLDTLARRYLRDLRRTAYVDLRV